MQGNYAGQPPGNSNLSLGACKCKRPNCGDNRQLDATLIVSKAVKLHVAHLDGFHERQLVPGLQLSTNLLKKIIHMYLIQLTKV